MSFTFPDPSVSTSVVNPTTGVEYEYKDGMWIPVSTDAETVDLDELRARVVAAEGVNTAQSAEIEQNEELGMRSPKLRTNRLKQITHVNGIFTAEPWLF